MTEPRKANTLVWSSGGFAAVVLYVLSWGPMTAHFASLSIVGIIFNAEPFDIRPNWMRVLYAPLDRLADTPALSHISCEYFTWCRETLHIGPPIASSKP